MVDWGGEGREDKGDEERMEQAGMVREKGVDNGSYGNGEHNVCGVGEG